MNFMLTYKSYLHIDLLRRDISPEDQFPGIIVVNTNSRAQTSFDCSVLMGFEPNFKQGFSVCKEQSRLFPSCPASVSVWVQHVAFLADALVVSLQILALLGTFSKSAALIDICNDNILMEVIHS